jgi:hypothetical protein
MEENNGSVVFNEISMEQLGNYNRAERRGVAVTPSEPEYLNF